GLRRDGLVGLLAWIGGGVGGGFGRTAATAAATAATAAAPAGGAFAGRGLVVAGAVGVVAPGFGRLRGLGGRIGLGYGSGSIAGLRSGGCGPCNRRGRGGRRFHDVRVVHVLLYPLLPGAFLRPRRLR